MLKKTVLLCKHFFNRETVKYADEALQMLNVMERNHRFKSGKAIAEEKKYHGYFALVSNCEKDPFECLRKYRKRSAIEFFFESGKQRADGSRTRVWTSDALMGRMFVQFVALCYYEYLSEQIREMKLTLAVENGDPVHDSKENLKMETKLKNWLRNTPVYLALQWFDVIEEVNVSSKLHTRRWTTELTERDRMFLRKLGMQVG